MVNTSESSDIYNYIRSKFKGEQIPSLMKRHKIYECKDSTLGIKII